jgi:hypothetical protein
MNPKCLLRTCHKTLRVVWEEGMCRCPPTLIELSSWPLSSALASTVRRHLCFLRSKHTNMTVGFPVWTKHGGEQAVSHSLPEWPHSSCGHSTSANQNRPWRGPGCWGLFTRMWFCFSSSWVLNHQEDEWGNSLIHAWVTLKPASQPQRVTFGQL